MPSSVRRVRKLHFSSSHESSLAADLHHLQDAFNIASLPGLPPNGLLLIKRLELGSLAPHSSAIDISRRLDQQLLSLHQRPVCVDQGEAPHANIVWFSDSARALARLLELTLRRLPATAWYWPVACPSIHQAGGISELIGAAVADLLPTSMRLSIVASLLGQHFAAGHGQQLLDSFEPSLAQRMLCDADIYPLAADALQAANDDVNNHVNNISTTWCRAVSQAVQRWGEDDVRSQWLAISALVSQNPALLSDRKGLVLEAKAALQWGGRGLKMGAQNDAHEAAYGTPGQQLHGKQSSEHGQPARWNSDETADARLSVTTHALQAANPDSTDQALSRSGPVNAASTDSALRSDRQVSSGPVIKQRETSRPGRDPRAVKELARPRNRTPAGVDSTSHDTMPAAQHWPGMAEHGQAGLLLLVALLERLQVSEVLQHHPQLASSNLPARTLRTLAGRYGIGEQHPLLQALVVPQRNDNETIATFCCPDSWVLLADQAQRSCPRLQRQRIAGSDSLCCITDRRRRLLLYAGPDDDRSLPAWHRKAEVSVNRKPAAPVRHTDIERTLLLMMARYARRFGGISLRGLIMRSGTIVATRTHLDLLFDLARLDIAVRRAGLDINPGWVDWLGRVVQIHYRDRGYG